MKKFLNWLLSLFSLFQTSYDKYNEIAKRVVEFINTLKSGIESGTLDALAALTPSKKDDELVIKIKSVFSSVAQKIAAIEGLTSGRESAVDALHALLTHISSNSKDGRVKFWIILSGELMKALADGKLTIAEAVALTQLVYRELKK